MTIAMIIHEESWEILHVRRTTCPAQDNLNSRFQLSEELTVSERPSARVPLREFLDPSLKSRFQLGDRRATNQALINYFQPPCAGKEEFMKDGDNPSWTHGTVD